jgi:hypothetical protein
MSCLLKKLQRRLDLRPALDGSLVQLLESKLFRAGHAPDYGAVTVAHSNANLRQSALDMGRIAAAKPAAMELGYVPVNPPMTASLRTPLRSDGAAMRRTMACSIAARSVQNGTTQGKLLLTAVKGVLEWISSKVIAPFSLRSRELM